MYRKAHHAFDRHNLIGFGTATNSSDSTHAAPRKDREFFGRWRESPRSKNSQSLARYFHKMRGL